MKKIVILIIFLMLSQPVFADNKRDYEWFTSQKNTGTYSKINCGPVVAIMSLKWISKDFALTTEDARKTIKSNGGNWYTDDIKKYIKDNGGKVSEIAFPSEEAMIKKMDNSILILCVDTGILYGKKRSDGGHFVIVKGYVPKAGEAIVSDPLRYNIGDRYPYENLAKAAKAWWNYALEVTDNKE